MIEGLAGTTWPWKIGPNFQYDDDVVYTSIVDIIFTSIGERKMNTSHGGEVLRVVFENKGEFLKALANREITLSLRQHLSIVKVLNVDVIEGERDTDPVEIVVDYEFQGVRSVAQVLVQQ